MPTLTVNNVNTDCNVFNAPVYGAVFLPPGSTVPTPAAPAEEAAAQARPVCGVANATPTDPAATPSYTELEQLRRETVRRAIATLMEERIAVRKEGRDRTEPLINKKLHWQGVYRILVDEGYCRDSDFKGCIDFLTPLLPEHPTAELDHSALRAITKTDYARPFNRWQYNPSEVRRETFDRMVAIATRFRDLLHQEANA